MTNEELAERIYAGDTGLYSVLWDNLKRYIYRLCNAYYNRRRERLTACDVTREDLEQEAYFTLYDAVEAYHTTDKRYKVITCLKYPLLNCFNGLAGYRVHRACKEPLNGYRSLYEPIDGEDGALLVEMIPDEAASFEDDAIGHVDRSAIYADMARILQGRPELIELMLERFVQGKQVRDIAAQRGTTSQAMRAQLDKALRMLRHPSNGLWKKYGYDIAYASMRHTGLQTFRYTQTSAVEWAAILLMSNATPPPLREVYGMREDRWRWDVNLYA